MTDSSEEVASTRDNDSFNYIDNHYDEQARYEAELNASQDSTVGSAMTSWPDVTDHVSNMDALFEPLLWEARYDLAIRVQNSEALTGKSALYNVSEPAIIGLNKYLMELFELHNEVGEVFMPKIEKENLLEYTTPLLQPLWEASSLDAKMANLAAALCACMLITTPQPQAKSSLTRPETEYVGPGSVFQSPVRFWEWCFWCL